MEDQIDDLTNIHQVLVERLAPTQPHLFSEGFSIDRMHELNTIRKALDNPGVVRAVSAILVEHQRAVEKWPEWPTDTTHAAAILAGEGGECLKAANHHREGRRTEGKDSLFMVAVEATQAGAMAVRLLENHSMKAAQ